MGFFDWIAEAEESPTEIRLTDLTPQERTQRYLELNDLLAKARFQEHRAKEYANWCAGICQKAESIYSRAAAATRDLERMAKDFK